MQILHQCHVFKNGSTVLNAQVSWEIEDFAMQKVLESANGSLHYKGWSLQRTGEKESCNFDTNGMTHDWDIVNLRNAWDVCIFYIPTRLGSAG